MKSNLQKVKVLIALIVMLDILLINPLLINFLSPSQGGDQAISEFNSDTTPKIEGLSPDNAFSGIGQAWNITHWANRTDDDLSVSFEEGNTGETGIPLYTNWEATSLESRIYNLYDTRNWNNGSFHFGDSDSIIPNENDSLDIVNSFQNWNFHEIDTDDENFMSGNYVNSSATIAGGHDCLELRMDGDEYFVAGNYRYRYDQDDRGWWESDFAIPRGKLIDSVLKFEVNPIHLISFNSWEFTVTINNVQVFSIGIFTLKKMGVNTWHEFNVPQGIWTNTSRVFPWRNLTDNSINIEVALHYTATEASYGIEDGENTDYQQILFDNVELVTTAEVRPSDLQLKLNGTSVNDVDWGKGEVEINGNWASKGPELGVSFSADDESLPNLGTYSVDLTTSINLFAFKSTPDSNYETNVASLGTKFTVINGSEVNWLCYGKVKVPTRYEENLMRIEFPEDVIIQSVFEPQNPTINKLSLCDNSTPGVLNIDIPSISPTPDGFWKFLARSPNYCENLFFSNNRTGSWVSNNQFLAGEYLNITAEINNSPLVSSYIQNTQAKLQIKFPNGSLWKSVEQFAQVESDGFVQFEIFQIPQTYPDYKEGKYQAIISWNNSYSINPLNESGLILKTFDVIHDSILEPENKFYQDNFKYSIINLKVSYSDIISGSAIRSALIYTYRYDTPTVMERFAEISPGYYFLEFNLTGAVNGNNSLNIYANSTYFENKILSITIEVINRTELVLSEDFVTNVPFKQNFTIQVDYLDTETGLGISGADLTTDWEGDYHFLEVTPGTYNLTCNASAPAYVAGELHSFNIFADAYMYQFQSAIVKVFITELDTILSVRINDSTTISANDIYSVDVTDEVNITVEYRDINGNHLEGATIDVSSSEFTNTLIENPSAEQYSIILYAITFGQGIDNFVILAQKDNYKPVSIPFIFEITERETYYEVFLNGEDSTIDPTLDLLIGNTLNITFKYYDIGGSHIPDASLYLSGDYTGYLSEDANQYTLLIDTSNFDIGVRLLTLSASKTNYESQSVVLRIQIKRIAIDLELESGTPIVPVSPGGTAVLRITLNNPLTNQSIIGANVSYSWIFGKGSLLDPENDGTYETTIGGVQEGSYTIIIKVDAGDQYDFPTLEITLVVVRSPDEILPFQIILIISIISAVVVGIYLTLYLTILKYPKPIRRVRKYSKTLRREKMPKTDVVDREQAFRTLYDDTTSGSSKLLKGKPSTEEPKIDKLIEKTSQNTLENLSGATKTDQKTGGEEK